MKEKTIVAPILLCGNVISSVLLGVFIALSLNGSTVRYINEIVLFAGLSIGLCITLVTRAKMTTVDGTAADKIQKLEKEVENRKTVEQKLKADLSQANAAVQNGRVKKSAEERLKELEAFDSSFPFKLSDGALIYGLRCSEFVANSHSRWILYGEVADSVFSVELLRHDVQDKSELLKLIKGTATVQELSELNLTQQQLLQR